MTYTDTVGDIQRVTIAALYPLGIPGQQVQETNLAYQCVSSGGGDSRNGLGAAVLGFFNANLLPVMAVNTSIYGYKVSQLGVYPPPLAASLASSSPGTGGTGPLGTQMRGLIRVQTATGGRTGRGRMYIFTPDNNAITVNGDPTATYLLALTNLKNALANAILTGGTVWAPGVSHRGPGAKPPYTFTLLTEMSRVDHWVTQRRSGESGKVNAAPW